MSRPAVEGRRAERDSVAEGRSSGEKPEGDEGGDPGHASRDEKTTAGRKEEHRRGGDEVWTHVNTHTRVVHLSPTRKRNAKVLEET